MSFKYNTCENSEEVVGIKKTVSRGQLVLLGRFWRTNGLQRNLKRRRRTATNKWVELGRTSSSGAAIVRLAHAVKLSGGEKTTAYILRQKDANKLNKQCKVSKLV
jgi:hypothetical protein